MNWLLDIMQKQSQKIAINFKGNSYKYSELYNRIIYYNNFISSKIPKHSVVVLLAEYSFESISLFFALIQNKNIIVPITNCNKKEIEERISESYADFRINLHQEFTVLSIKREKEYHNLITQIQSNKHAGLLLFSSGSTGKPKTMIHDLDILLDSFQNKKSKNLNFLIFLMFDHIGGLNTLFNCISMGATITIPENRDPSYICELIERYSIDILPTTPTFLNLISISQAYKKFNIQSLKVITYGTEPMPSSLLLRLRKILPKVKFLQTFGTSETGIAKVLTKSSTSTFIKINDPDIEYKIVDNELWLRSKTQIIGYLNAPMVRFTQDGWFKTGDIVEQDIDGYIRIIGRNSELINVGGQKVLPQEVECILLQIPQIIDCRVYGEPNFITGQIVVAEIVIETGIEFNEIKKIIRKTCREQLDSYKNPVKILQILSIEFNERFKKNRK